MFAKLKAKVKHSILSKQVLGNRTFNIYSKDSYVTKLFLDEIGNKIFHKNANAHQLTYTDSRPLWGIATNEIEFLTFVDLWKEKRNAR